MKIFLFRPDHGHLKQILNRRKLIIFRATGQIVLVTIE